MDADFPEKAIRTQFLFRIDLKTGYQQDVANGFKGTPWGDLVNVPVIGGSVTGGLINGSVVNMGGDWGVKTMRICRNFDTEKAIKTEVTELNCSLVIKTDDPTPAFIEMSYTGTSYGEEDYSYFRSVPRFRTASEEYAYLNSAVAVGRGTHRKAAGPLYDVYLVL